MIGGLRGRELESPLCLLGYGHMIPLSLAYELDHDQLSRVDTYVSLIPLPLCTTPIDTAHTGGNRGGGRGGAGVLFRDDAGNGRGGGCDGAELSDLSHRGGADDAGADNGR